MRASRGWTRCILMAVYPQHHAERVGGNAMNSNWTQLLGFVVVALGWLVNGWLAGRRDARNKRRELVLTHLVESYRFLTQEFGRRAITPDSIRRFENLMADIQLFGTRKQVELAARISRETCEDGVSPIDPLVEEMRDYLRRELSLDAVEGTTIWLRFRDDMSSTPSATPAFDDRPSATGVAEQRPSTGAR